jgi:hypothetical protein
MKTKLLLALMVFALAGIGSCSEPKEPIESPYNPVAQVIPDQKTMVVCPKGDYGSECDYGKITPLLCPKCQTETTIAVCIGN